MQLRTYQVNAVDQLRENIRKGIKSQLLCVATGGGKTVIASTIIQGAVKKGSHILFLAHRRELIEQCAAKLEDFGVLNYSIIMSGAKRFNPNATVHVASLQTLIKRDFPKADLIIIDEAHRAASKSYRDVLANYPKAKVLGLSATPERLDGKGLDDLFEEMVEVISIPDLINDGFLVKPTLYSGKFNSDLLAGIKKRNGDYAEGELQEAMDKPKLIGDIIANWRDKSDGKLTVVFACGVEHSAHIAQEFFNAGIPAASIHGGMSTMERESIIRDWRRGFIRVVVNCMILTEGFDFPELECCILARPTKSISLALQMMGRIMRTASGKQGAIVLDHAGILDMHGAPYIAREWSLHGEQERKKTEEKLNITTCDCCQMVYIPEPKAWLDDVQEKVLVSQRGKVKDLLKSKASSALSNCTGCGMAVCRVCNNAFKLSMNNTDIDGVAYTKQGHCPHCFALYTDAAAHVVVGDEKPLPTSTDDMLQLYDGDEIPLAVLVKNKFRQNLKFAREKGYKRGWAFHQVIKEFGDDAKDLIPRHTAEWYRGAA